MKKEEEKEEEEMRRKRRGRSRRGEEKKRKKGKETGRGGEKEKGREEEGRSSSSCYWPNRAGSPDRSEGVVFPGVRVVSGHPPLVASLNSHTHCTVRWKILLAPRFVFSHHPITKIQLLSFRT